ncbi:TetR/AcrR family transcriptional regulator [Rhodococcus chondri]|uniref:TetR/AcrR family transcriptional regulator n=1 Tax=Rhodococcus chondri TaxID=3065941 RepID=A0ABU7JV35_9NOCA|nr:TetR/AcrR family transcriptional regulator [Rhodococcus sp. CC-R104]MEE2033889.1 TetR/AcrR family transcriptional regulator [Rhodococcus sp. CC-R104]
MASPRRIGSPDAKNRNVLLDAAEQVMLESGYAAVTSRRVAEKAGLKPQLVHYYFRTMDELFLEMFRRRAEEGLQQQAKVLDSPNPLRALWEYSIDPAAVAVTMEFIAMARHRDSLRAEIARYSELFRAGQKDAAEKILQGLGLDSDRVPPVVVSVLMTSISRVLVMEESLGVTAGHAETVELVEWWLRRFEGE